MDAYLELEGTEWYCAACAPKGAGCYADGGGEADSPQHCATCLIPLENPLISDGIEYVLASLEAEVRNPDRDKAHENYNGTYYEGSPHKQILLDWADQVRYCGLLGEDEQARLEAAVAALTEGT